MIEGLAFFRNGVREHGIFSGQGYDSRGKRSRSRILNKETLRTIMVHAEPDGIHGR